MLRVRRFLASHRNPLYISLPQSLSIPFWLIRINGPTAKNTRRRFPASSIIPSVRLDLDSPFEED